MSGKHAAPDFHDQVNGLLADISWRATRYAMDHDQTSHDVMTEAHTVIRQFLVDPDATTEPCDCMATHAGCKP